MQLITNTLSIEKGSEPFETFAKFRKVCNKVNFGQNLVAYGAMGWWELRIALHRLNDARFQIPDRKSMSAMVDKYFNWGWGILIIMFNLNVK